MIEKILYIFRFFFNVKLKKRVFSKGLVFLQRNVRIIVEQNSKLILGENIVIKEGSTIYAKKNAKIVVGDNTSTGHHTEISANNNIRIGSDVIMGAYTYITDSNHGYEDFGIPIRKNPMEVGETTIGSNVWLGRNAMLLKDSRIGDHSIVAAGSIVTKRFPNDVIIGGIPAKIIKSIYD